MRAAAVVPGPGPGGARVRAAAPLSVSAALVAVAVTVTQQELGASSAAASFSYWHGRLRPRPPASPQYERQDKETHLELFWRPLDTLFPAFYSAARIAATLTTSSAAAERAFSLFKQRYRPTQRKSRMDKINSSVMQAFNAGEVDYRWLGRQAGGGGGGGAGVGDGDGHPEDSANDDDDDDHDMEAPAPVLGQQLFGGEYDSD